MAGLFEKQMRFADDTNGDLACLVLPNRLKFDSFRRPVQALNQCGYQVALYALDHDVLAKGNPQDLAESIDAVVEDFADLSDSRDGRICALGASLGALCAYNVLRNNERVKRGVFATAGVSMAWAVANMAAFTDTWHEFQRQGINEQALTNAWSSIDVSAEQPPAADKNLTVVLGTNDSVVDYRKAMDTIEAWQKAGVSVDVITRELGHMATIGFFARNISALLTNPKSLVDD